MGSEMCIRDRYRDLRQREEVPLTPNGFGAQTDSRIYAQAACFARAATFSSFLTCSMISLSSDSGTQERRLSVGSSSIFSAIYARSPFRCG